MIEGKLMMELLVLGYIVRETLKRFDICQRVHFLKIIYHSFKLGSIENKRKQMSHYFSDIRTISLIF
jgi:hypothetical protein